MHCAYIRVFLHHYKQGENLRVNDDIKTPFKQRRFKWKTLKNDALTGVRIEILEGQNLEYKEQLSVESAFIYRRGMAKEDFGKDTLSVCVKSTSVEHTGSDGVLSMAALLNEFIRANPGTEFDTDKEDRLSSIREALAEKDLPKIMDPLQKNVSDLISNLL